jgi:hypothetical protein
VLQHRTAITPGCRNWKSGLLASVGFSVTLPAGEVGCVEAVRLDPETAEPKALVVGSGRVWAILVPIDEVELVRPADSTVVLGPCSLRLVALNKPEVEPAPTWMPAA